MQTNTINITIIMTNMNTISKYDTVRIRYDACLSLGRNKDCLLCNIVNSEMSQIWLLKTVL